MSRAVGIIIQSGKIALIRRRVPGLTYFVFPGGTIETGETPLQAVKREVTEELGIRPVDGKLVFIFQRRGSVEYYFLIQGFTGRFGTGKGPEMNQTNALGHAAFEPVWLDVGESKGEMIFPREISILIIKAHGANSWPETPCLVME